MEEKTIWQCHNPECNAQYSEYVNGCPKCSSGEPGGSHKVSILNKFHPVYGDGLPQSPEMDLILRIVANWGNAIEMPKMEGWVREYAKTGARWVKASERLPGLKTPVKWRQGETELKVKPVWYMVLDTNSEYLSKCEWLDEGK